jgi:hypothetical protein
VVILYITSLWTMGWEGKVVLIWDIYAQHRDALVKVKAKELKIWSSYIPTGMIDKLQPLERGIFGSFTAKAEALVVRRYE